MAARATSHEQMLEDLILEAMARRLWVHAYMAWALDVDPAVDVQGYDWDAAAPNNSGTRAASLRAAKALTELLVQENNLPKTAPLCHLYRHAAPTYRRLFPDVTIESPVEYDVSSPEEQEAWMFGQDVVDSCLGTSDALRDAGIVDLPGFSVELDDDGSRLSWDGGVSLDPRDVRRNPPRGPGVLSEFGERILLLEDEPALQQGTARMIGKIFPGVKVITTDNVDAAMAYLRVHPVVYIVSDVDVLGDKSGLDLFHHVQDQHPELVDKFLFFTGNDEAFRAHYRVLLKGGATVDDMKSAVSAPAPSPRARMAKTASPPPRVETPASPDATRLSLAEFVRVIEDALPRIRGGFNTDERSVGRFGNRKVFISAVWRAIRNDPRLGGLTESQFKSMLLDALKSSLLELARADLVAAMDEGEVKSSTITSHGAQFHFVIDPNAPDFGDDPRFVSGGAPARTAKAPSVTTSTPSIEEFAAGVNNLLRHVKQSKTADGKYKGRLGEKVFITAAWAARGNDRRVTKIGMLEFKDLLLEANRLGLVTLARADIKGMFDAEESRVSEIQDRGAEFHFIIDRDYDSDRRR